jgi:hypothetical protein
MSIQKFTYTLPLLMFLTSICHSELQELEDSQLATYLGQAVIKEDANNQPLLLAEQDNNVSQAQLLPSFKTTKNHSAGITMDIFLDMHIAEIRWVDVDGAGTNGTQGSVTLSNVYIGGGSASSPSPASIKGITLDVSGANGINLGVQKIGGPVR